MSIDVVGKCSPASYKCEELFACLLLSAEAAEHARCDSRRTGLLYASHRHAQMSIQKVLASESPLEFDIIIREKGHT